MTQNRTITIDCLFLHDTPMSVLEQEQRECRTHFPSSDCTSGLPFNILPPFFPCRRTFRPEGILAGSPVNQDGWIIRPVTEKRIHRDKPELPETGQPAGIPESPATAIAFPQYPPLPRVPAFILGYAGTKADEIISRLGNPEFSKAGTEPSVTGSFSAHIWYFARMIVTIEFRKDFFYSVRYETGPADWHKGTR